MKQTKPIVLILMLLGLIYYIGSTIYLGSFDPNHRDSDNYTSKSQRVNVLNNEIRVFSDFSDAEFELFNVNGFSNSRVTVPGASSWDYKFVIKVDSINIDQWTDGMILIETEDEHEWRQDIIQERKANWRTESIPEIYTRPENNGVIMFVYRSEGIIYKRLIAS